ncbi:unnamed protein product [Ectocarpus fasciculatus]
MKEADKLGLPRTNQQRRVVRYVYAAGEKSLERQARLEAIMSRNTPREHLPSGEKEHHVAVNSRHGGAVGVSDRASTLDIDVSLSLTPCCSYLQRQQERGGGEAARGRPTTTGKHQGNNRVKATTNSWRQHQHHGGHASVPNEVRRPTGGGREPGAKRDRRSKETMARVAEECKRKAIERARKKKRGRSRPERRRAAKAIVE